METIIHSNGSKWLGQEPDTIEKLLEVLAAQPLDRSFEAFGNFVTPCERKPSFTSIFVNFYHLSHVFNIDSNDPAIVERLSAAIRANQRRPDYLSQSTYEEIKAAAEAGELERHRKDQEAQHRQARVTLGLEAA